MSDTPQTPDHGPQQGSPSPERNAGAATQDCHRPMPASLLRRLAEAADGLIGPKWIVASYTLINGEHDIVGRPYDSRAEAQSYVPNADYDVFGPYGLVTTRTPHPPIERFGIHIEGGAVMEIRGEDFDAFFWSESALRKFALPYYANVVSPEYAIRLREQFMDPNVVMMAHDPMTEYSLISIDRGGRTAPV